MRRDLQQPVAIERPVRVLGEHLEQIELARRERLLVARGRIDQHALFQVEHAPAHAHARTGARGRAGGAAQHALHAGEQLARLERLGDVVVGAGLEPDHPVHGVGRGRHHDDADAARALAQPAREDEAVLARQADVEQHQRRQLALQQLAQGGAAVGAADAEVLLAKVVDQQLPLRRLILDHDNMRTMVHSAESPVPVSPALPPIGRCPVVAWTVSRDRQNANSNRYPAFQSMKTRRKIFGMPRRPGFSRMDCIEAADRPDAKSSHPASGGRITCALDAIRRRRELPTGTPSCKAPRGADQSWEGGALPDAGSAPSMAAELLTHRSAQEALLTA